MEKVSSILFGAIVLALIFSIQGMPLYITTFSITTEYDSQFDMTARIPNLSFHSKKTIQLTSEIAEQQTETTSDIVGPEGKSTTAESEKLNDTSSPLSTTEKQTTPNLETSDQPTEPSFLFQEETFSDSQPTKTVSALMVATTTMTSPPESMLEGQTDNYYDEGTTEDTVNGTEKLCYFRIEVGDVLELSPKSREELEAEGQVIFDEICEGDVTDGDRLKKETLMALVCCSGTGKFIGKDSKNKAKKNKKS